MDLILANSELEDIQYLNANADFSLGNGDNTFEITVSRDVWNSQMNFGNVIYIADTEFGGFIQEIKTVTSQSTVSLCGYTWRGMLNNQILTENKAVKGELNSVLSSILPFFSVSSVDTGVNISYTLTKYISLLKNIEEMLKTVNYKLQIKCSNEKVEISAVPIIDFSDEIELSQDYQLDFNFDDKRNGVNHLICVGKDENKQELIINLYSDKNGNISKTQSIFGTDKIDSLYESSKSTLEEIEEDGIEKFKELISKKTFEMNVANLSLPNIEIGDIVGGRDYLTGQTIKKPITGKILMINDDVLSLEFKIEGEGE